MKFLLSLVLSFIFINSQAQELLNEAQLLEDFGILTTVTVELSPNLNDPDKQIITTFFNERSEDLKGNSMTAIDFFKFLMNTKSKSNISTKSDEHSSLSLSNEVLKQLLSEKSVLFPVPIVIINHQVIVNSEQTPIPFGSIIHEINQEPVSAILNKLTGNRNSNSTFTLHNIEKSFDLLYLIQYSVPKTFQISYKEPNDSITKTIQLDPIDIQTRESLHKENVYPLNKETLNKTINTSYFKEMNSYYIQLNSFKWRDNDVKNEYETFDEMFSNIFKDIKKQNPKNLIVDLRYNMGGNMYIPGLFYSYLAKEDFNEDMILKVPDFELPFKEHIVAIENRPVTKEKIETFLVEFKKPFVKNNDHYEVAIVKNKIHKPSSKSYKGTVYLLIGGRTFSAATYFTALFKNNKRGILVGEQIGGSHNNITAGQQVKYALPNSKIEVSMPLGVFEFSKDIQTNVPEHKIAPDFEVSNELKYQYFLEKKDWDLREVMNIINDK